MKKYNLLVGILAASSPTNQLFIGNVYLFKQIQLQLLKRNGFSFVFTPQDVHKKEINGVYYDPIKNRWLKTLFPLPHIIYNRYPFREDEYNIQRLLKKMESFQIPYFNRSFFNKWTIYKQLSTNRTLKPFIPISSFIETEKDVFSFLNKFHRAYLKPVSCSQGKGILKITQNSSQTYNLYTKNRSFENVLKEELWNKMQLLMINTPYFIQEEIQSDDVNGMKYDLRILVHLNQTTYEPTGIGVRAIEKNYITTHVPNGGQILPFQLVESRIQHDQVDLICNEIGHTLTYHHGVIGEFSLDVAVSKNGKLYVFEVNSKPMKFDEKKIFQKGLSRLTNLFYQLGYQEKDQS
jgi:hypothetical protein